MKVTGKDLWASVGMAVLGWLAMKYPEYQQILASIIGAFSGSWAFAKTSPPSDGNVK